MSIDVLDRNSIRAAEQYVIQELPEEMFPVQDYDEYHVNISGGVDSVAVTLMTLYGYQVPKEKIKLVHMRVDGDPNDPLKRQLFDWPQTDEYLRYFSEELRLPLFLIWGEKSLEERIRERGKFPDASCRFCTSYMKRDVYGKWVRQFDNCKILLLTGERSEESQNRANAPIFQVHQAQSTKRKNRVVHWFRPIKHMLKFQVRQLAADYGIELHPCYQWVSRCSCKFCIFNTSGELTRISQLYPDDWQYIKNLEDEIGHTMKSRRGKSFSLADFIKEDQIPLFV
ncbi:phosphoadenosine phosphosulfate reductase family protein [Bacillus cereus]|nr:phosphoadenosine phosphosulfate reductase family protein [Bacillus cereus]